jgi:SAM-dependent methyltransferase
MDARLDSSSCACPLGFDTARLRERILETYGLLADDPQSRFHFNTGVDYAVQELRYDRAELAALPPAATSRFAGVGNPLRLGAIRRDACVLDHACGAGTDLLLAARRLGPGGRAIGVDVTPEMRRVAEAAAQEAGLQAIVEVRAGAFESLPVDDASVDVVISNGVVNLAPDKARVFAEIRRVLKPGGALYLADVVANRPLAGAAREDADLWASCIGGAATEAQLLALARSAGFARIQVVERFDCFRGTALATKLGTGLKVYGANLLAQ